MNTSRTGQARGRKGKRRGFALTLAHLGRAAGNQEGFGLVEVLVAVAIVGMTVVALLAALSTGSIGVATTDEQVTAANLARSQLEYTRSQPYAPGPRRLRHGDPACGIRRLWQRLPPSPTLTPRSRRSPSPSRETARRW